MRAMRPPTEEAVSTDKHDAIRRAVMMAKRAKYPLGDGRTLCVMKLRGTRGGVAGKERRGSLARRRNGLRRPR